MYESFFGISGPPFQLSADPTFYFDSQGHRQALADLRRGLATPEAVVLVSGEIGAGKTMLVRTVVAEFDSGQVVVGQIVSSQLDAQELQHALMGAFGISAVDAKPADLASRLAGFLADLASQGRRAVLIIDEAQNLGLDALAWLGKMIGPGPGPGSRPHLQVCLVGQPELRALIETPEALPLRQRLGAACHLGPLSVQETRAYIEHRLSRVGWADKPRFEAAAFEEIHRWTFGTPRRINLVCNRLMLTLFLASQLDVDAAIVAKTAKGLRAEVGDAELGFEDPPTRTVTPSVSPLHDAKAISTAAPARPRRLHKLRETSTDGLLITAGPVLFVAASRLDCLKLVPVLLALADHPGAPMARLVIATSTGAIEWDGLLANAKDVADDRVELSLPQGLGAQQVAELTLRFDLVVADYRPPTIVVLDGTDVALTCGLVAKRRGLRVVHLGAGVRSGNRSEAAEIVRMLTDQLADLLYVGDETEADRLSREGATADRIEVVGNLTVDAVQACLALQRNEEPGSWQRMLRGLQADRHGYGLVVVEQPSNLDSASNLGNVVLLLRDVSRDMPLLWPMPAQTQQGLESFGLDVLMEAERIAKISPRSFEELIPLLKDATCLFTDVWLLQEVATALGVPCLTVGEQAPVAATVNLGSNTPIGFSSTLATRAVWEIIFNGGKRGTKPVRWDGHASARIAAHFVKWLADTLMINVAATRSARVRH